MKKAEVILVAVVSLFISACGGGGGGVSSGSAAAIQPVAPQGVPVGTPNAHGLYPLANGTYPSDAEAGVFANENGFARSYSTAGKIDPDGPFFKSFGSGRNCGSCHKQEDGFSITPKSLQQIFAATDGKDPVFQAHDGANSPHAAVATVEERRSAYSLLLNRGLFRIGLKIPATADFELVKVDSPYAPANADELSLFRRPLPSANLKFSVDVMWDGRETALDSNSRDCSLGNCYATLASNLGRQASHATTGHAQAKADLSKADQDSIVAFESTLFTAQQVDNAAGLLLAKDGTGGALTLSTTAFSFGLNDIFKVAFTPRSFRLFTDWISDAGAGDKKVAEARASISRGQEIFNSKEIFPKHMPEMERVFSGHFFVNCSTCHSTPGVGTISEPQLFDIGLSDAKARTPDMPLYTLRNKRTGELIETVDPGQAMITGFWQHIGRFKVPGLRGLSMRAPYFHDGSAKTIEEVTAFYDKQFDIQFTPQELADLNAFLKAL